MFLLTIYQMRYTQVSMADYPPDGYTAGQRLPCVVCSRCLAGYSSDGMGPCRSGQPQCGVDMYQLQAPTATTERRCK